MTRSRSSPLICQSTGRRPNALLLPRAPTITTGDITTGG